VMTQLSEVSDAENADPVARRAFSMPARKFAFVGTEVSLIADVRTLCVTEGVATTGPDGTNLLRGPLIAALRAHYVVRYEQQPDLIGIPPTAQPLVDEIAARPARPRRATPGAAPSIAPTPSSRRPRPPSTGAEEGRPVQRRRRAAAAPRVQTHDQMRAAASTAADRALIDLINDASSGEEEEEAERAARRDAGLDNDFEDDVAPSPARPRRSTRGGRA
jgi:hypothetical protein